MPPSVIPITVQPGSRPQSTDASITRSPEAVPARRRLPLAAVVVEPLQAVQWVVVPCPVGDRLRDAAVAEAVEAVESLDEALAADGGVADVLDRPGEHLGREPLVRR